MDKTSNLQLPFIPPSQAQKHVTHNETLLSLDAIVQLSAISQSMTLPPSSMLIHDSSWPQTSHSGIFSYDTGPSLSLMHHSLGNSMKNLGASPLNGTTGLDGSSSIAVKSGAIVIENRFGSEQKYSFTFLG